jgi:hypothetical protein
LNTHAAVAAADGGSGAALWDMHASRVPSMR